MPRAERRNPPGELKLAVNRLLSAPPAVIWRAWTDPRQIERWWHPAAFRRPVCERLDLRVGGGFRIVMQAQDGAVYAAWGIYREIVSDRKLAYDGRCDKDGQTFHAATEVVTFAPEGAAATRVTIDTTIDLTAYAGTEFTTPMITQGWTEGWEQNLAGLATLLSEPTAAGRPAGVTPTSSAISPAASE